MALKCSILCLFLAPRFQKSSGPGASLPAEPTFFREKHLLAAKDYLCAPRKLC